MANAQMVFRVMPLTFEFAALDAIHFPAGKLTNILRGAFGLELRRQWCLAECRDSKVCALPTGQMCVYRQVFEGETGEARPSGYREPPRPFVFRCANWGELTLKPGQRLVTQLNLFDLRAEVLDAIVRTHWRMAGEGLGAGRGRLQLRRIVQQPGSGVGGVAGEHLLWESGGRAGMGSIARPGALEFDLDSTLGEAPSRVKAEFLTPTELKSGGAVARDASFGRLFRRLHERVWFLMTHYGQKGAGDEWSGGPGVLADASEIATVRQNLRDVDLERYSTRTRQSHPLSGFVGEGEYAGDFSKLWPWLLASEWAGIGRQTVWGKGCVRWTALAS